MRLSRHHLPNTHTTNNLSRCHSLLGCSQTHKYGHAIGRPWELSIQQREAGIRCASRFMSLGRTSVIKEQNREIVIVVFVVLVIPTLPMLWSCSVFLHWNESPDCRPVFLVYLSKHISVHGMIVALVRNFSRNIVQVTLTILLVPLLVLESQA